MASIVRIADGHTDAGLALADASLVPLAERMDTTAIATLDERHFRMARPLSGAEALRLLPVDA